MRFDFRKIKVSERYGSIFVIGILVCTVLLTLILIVQGLDRNRSAHAFGEMERISKVQVNMLNMEIEDQYIPLNALADHISKDDAEFGKGDMIEAAEMLRSVHRLCTIGMADKNGDAIDYHGDFMGNISDRDYFRKVIDGSHDEYVMYLATTKSIDEPRMLFSVPVYQNQEIVGVIFASKEITILETALFIDEFFDETASSFIVDSDGNIIVANSKTYKELSENRLLENYKKNPDDSDAVQEKIKSILDKGNCGGCTSVMENGSYLTHADIDINDWVLFNVVDKHSVVLQYHKSETILLRLIAMLVAILFIAVILISIFFYLSQKRAIVKARSFRNQYKSYKSLLYELDCIVIEYDLVHGRFKRNVDFLKNFGIDIDTNFKEFIAALKKTHPEYNADELLGQVYKVRKERTSTSFESIIIIENNDVQWLKVVLMPIQNMKGEVISIFAAVMNTTEYHEEFEASSRFMEIVPGGMHRCYLDDPIHLEFASEGLCEMLGYTSGEFHDLVGSRYSLAITEEDRHIFREFVYELSKEEGTKTCEYRMICKDGTLLTVSDTMESKRDAAGIMYGYSIIVDLSEYKKKQEEMELELSETKAQLLQARIKNANSQMQPHFLYNALASIREIVLDDPEYASNLIVDFSTHLRACIRSMSNENLIDFSQELNNIQAYVNIEHMRFGEKLKVIYDIKAKDFDIIPLGLQPIVENAIRHGIYERGRAGGTVSVITYSEEDLHIVKIIDDGVGFDVEKMWKQIDDGTRDSTGLLNMKMRFEKQMKAKVNIESEPGIGTEVTIYIPKGAGNEGNNR